MLKRTVSNSHSLDSTTPHDRRTHSLDRVVHTHHGTHRGATTCGGRAMSTLNILAAAAADDDAPINDAPPVMDDG